jgi:ATP-dependent exoDNAse (exonuclease V) beta subunit
VIDVGDIRALPLREARRLLYTALTRAEDPLSVFGADVHEI